MVDIFSASQGLATLGCNSLKKNKLFFGMVFFGIVCSINIVTSSFIAFQFCGQRRKQWARAGFKSAAYDIKLSPLHDLCTRSGFMMLLTMCLSSLRSALDF